MKYPTTFLSLIITLLYTNIQAFVPLTNKPSFKTSITNPFQQQIQQPTFQEQRITKTSLNVFGLGAPEIAVILIAGAFLLGPQKLAELGKDAGKIAGELKEVPKEFQEGMMEGEREAMKMKKSIGEVKDTTATSDD